MPRSVAKPPLKDNGPRTLEGGHWSWFPNSVMTWVPVIGASGFLVYSILAEHADRNTQEAIIGQDAIARKACMSKRWAIETLAVLERCGLIEKHGFQLLKGVRVTCYLLKKIEPCREESKVNPSSLSPAFESELQFTHSISTKRVQEATPPPLIFCKERKTSKAPEIATAEDFVSGKMDQIRHAIDEQAPNLAWTAKALALLRTEVKRIPWTAAQWVTCVKHRYQSEGVGRDDLPENFILKLQLYISGPLDRFGKVMEVGNGATTGTTPHSAAQRTRQSVDIVLKEIDDYQRLHPEDVDDDDKPRPRYLLQ